MNLDVDVYFAHEIARTVREQSLTDLRGKLAQFLGQKESTAHLGVEGYASHTHTGVCAVLAFPSNDLWQEVVDLVGSTLSGILGGQYEVELRDGTSSQPIGFNHIPVST